MNLQERLRSELSDTALEDAAWPAFLMRFASHLGATEVAMGGAQPGGVHEMIAPHTDPGFTGLYHETYHQQNSLMHAVLRQQAGTVTQTEELPEFAQFSRSDLYNLWCVPQSFNHGVALSLGSSTGWVGALVVNTRAPATSTQIETLRAFAPDLQKAVEQWRVLKQLRQANRLTLDTLDIAGLGALFLDRTGHVLDLNGQAHDMLADGRLQMRDGQLRGPEPQSDNALAQLITRCLLTPDLGGGRVQLAGPDGPLSVQCAPVPGNLAFPTPQRPVAIVLVTDPKGKLRLRISALSRLYGLTRAEAELALAVVETGSRKAAAELRGVSDTTARSQLTSIFDKTGVRRQTELVRLLLDDH